MDWVGLQQFNQQTQGAFSLHPKRFFCTPKMSLIPLLISSERVGESAFDAVNFIYCVTNSCTPKRYFFGSVSFLLHPDIHLKFFSHSLYFVVPQSSVLRGPL